MKNILVLGAGKSSSFLIKYLAEHAASHPYKLTVIDIHIDFVPTSIQNLDNVEVIKSSSTDVSIYKNWIKDSTITISMLPAFMHAQIASYCLDFESHLITPSYVSKEMRAMERDVKTKNLIFLNEMGFDPGIDHMTTMKIFHDIEEQGGHLSSYQSYAGGLVAKKNDNNPWNYKFSWNPRNVILAGQGGKIKYKEQGEIKTLSYHELFAKAQQLSISNGLSFDAYANRDSLQYESLYGWENLQTIIRGTLRCTGFCEGWNLLIQLGLTDDTIPLESVNGISLAEFYRKFIALPNNDFILSLSEPLREKMEYIGFLDTHTKVEQEGTAAAVLQSILEKKWKLEPQDTDWIVMVHQLAYIANSHTYQVESYLSLEGDDAIYTAMSKTVGMPIAFAAIMLLEEQIKEKGVLIPISKEIYAPILQKLEQIGIQFTEKTIQID